MEGGDIRLFIKECPQSLLTRWPNYFGKLLNFDLLVHALSWVSKRFNVPLIVIHRKGNFVYHHCIGDEHQFIGHCLIPLDPCHLPWIELVDDTFKSDDCKEPGAKSCQPGKGQHNKHNQALGSRWVQERSRLNKI